MDKKLLEERMIILQLAIQEAHRKKEQCSFALSKINDKNSSSYIELQDTLRGWEETIAEIGNWQEELKI